MRLGTIIAAVAVLFGLVAAGAALWFWASGESPLVQVTGQKGIVVPKEGDQRAQSPQAAPTQAGSTQPTWRVNCSSSEAGLDCRVTQLLFVKTTGQRFLALAVRVPPDTKTPELLVEVPLRTYLPAGVSLQFGGDAAKTVPFRSCHQSGCLATYAATEAEIGAMLKGTDVVVSIQDQQRRPITLTVPVKGFAEAYAKIR
jgi:invasion protein IalB